MKQERKVIYNDYIDTLVHSDCSDDVTDDSIDHVDNSSDEDKDHDDTCARVARRIELAKAKFYGPNEDNTDNNHDSNNHDSNNHDSNNHDSNNHDSNKRRRITD